jgi:hypothetical protein
LKEDVMKGRKVALAVAAVIVAALTLAFAGCSPTQPDAPPLPTSSNNCTVSGTNNSVNCGGGNQQVTAPTPSPSPGSSGDNVVISFAIFCYGFGTQPGQQEPNHDACQLPVGYPNIAVTASPKNAAHEDVPNPGDKTSEKVISWSLDVTPPSAATLVIQADNRFNAAVQPATPRVNGAVFALTATYLDPQGNTRVATKLGGIK